MSLGPQIFILLFSQFFTFTMCSETEVTVTPYYYSTWIFLSLFLYIILVAASFPYMRTRMYPRFPFFWFFLLVLFPPAFFVIAFYFLIIFFLLTPVLPITEEPVSQRQTRSIPQSRAAMRA